jgi:hypothetical protein
MLSRMNPDAFEWTLHRVFTPIDIIGGHLRLSALRNNREMMRRMARYAVGWCPSERCLVNPRTGWVCMMFFKDGEHGWFHVMREEFELVFCHKEEV